MKSNSTRREFLDTGSGDPQVRTAAPSRARGNPNVLVPCCGAPVRTKPSLGWPRTGQADEDHLLKALRNHRCGPGDDEFIPQFENAWCTRANYHVFGLCYEQARFQGVPRDKVVAALRAEDAPINVGYPRLNKESFLEHNFSSRAFQTVSSQERLEKYHRQNLPKNDELCSTGLWISQDTLVGEKNDVDIREALHKIERNASMLVQPAESSDSVVPPKDVRRQVKYTSAF